ncbi:MAG: ComF family protein [Defluviitaleaceae bacterium]|nr:ComF family protein [Defluviitaleaceae bacterium]
MMRTPFQTFKNPLSAVLDWVYPPKCLACKSLLPLNEERRFFCVICQGLFEPVGEVFCQTCGSPTKTEVKTCAGCFGKTFHFTYNRAAFLYDELMRDLMHDMKFREKRRIAEGLSLLWAEGYKGKTLYTGYEIVPLPMHPKKKRERGFNQAEIMAAALSHALKIPVSHALVRTVDTPPQAGLHPRVRAENVKGVFSLCEKTEPRGKKYILADDIFTTGASLNECAKTLKIAGAAEILCMTLAVSVKNKLYP